MYGIHVLRKNILLLQPTGYSINYSPWPKKEIWHGKFVTSAWMNFLSWFYFSTPMDYIVHGQKWNFGHFEGIWKRANLRNRKGHAHQNRFACIWHSFLIAQIYRADFIFDRMDYTPWSEREIWPNLKCSNIFKTGKALHTKKLACMHFTLTSTCMNFLSWFYFLTPTDYSLWSKREIWPFFKGQRKGKNLWNWRGHTHQNCFAYISHQPLCALFFWAGIWLFWRQMKWRKNLQSQRPCP